MLIRHVQTADYERAAALAQSWWDDRSPGARLSRVYFRQFAGVSFVLDSGDDLVGLVLGHLSQTRPDEAGVRFVGIAPAFRRLGLGRGLYERFFAAAHARGRRAVRVYVAPSDADAVGFHLAMGFEALPGDGEVDGLPVSLDHAGKGGHRVVFRRATGPEAAASPPALTRTC